MLASNKETYELLGLEIDLAPAYCRAFKVKLKLNNFIKTLRFVKKNYYLRPIPNSPNEKKVYAGAFRTEQVIV